MNFNTPAPYKNNYPLGKPTPLVNNPGLALCILFAIMFVMIGILSVAMAIIFKDETDSTLALRIATIFQNLLAFICPAVLAAMIATRLPATLLKLDVKPKIKPTLLACLILLTSLPALNYVIELNESLKLPDSMSQLEQVMRQMEESAQSAITTMIGGNTLFDLIFSILTIGILTGLAEELFFRGALQGLLFSTKMKRHLAIWIAAIVFSALHFQFYGFVPRLLLGAYFGYLIWWTGSVWVPVIAHAFNNSIAVIATWSALQSQDAESIESTIGQDTSNVVTITLSIIVTSLGIYILNRLCKKGG